MKTSAHNIRILSLLLLFTLLHSISEAKQYFFQQIPSQNGLSSMVRCMEVSQEKGYVWIGTRSGIGRFDGYEQRRYLRGNVTHILEDEDIPFGPSQKREYSATMKKKTSLPLCGIKTTIR